MLQYPVTMMYASSVGKKRVDARRIGPLTAVGWSLALFSIVVGGSLQGYANGAFDSLVVALMFFISGLGFMWMVFRGAFPEARAFIMTYTICILVGAIAQNYSLAAFGNPQSTPDAFTFVSMISPNPPFVTMEDVRRGFNSPLAVVLWQQVYKLTWWMNIDYGPHIAVMFNAMVVGITGGLTVNIARSLFGNDHWRLRRVGTLFALCGMFWLFGAILIRDGITTAVNLLFVWSLVRWLTRPGPMSFVTALVTSGLCLWAMANLRTQAVFLFGLYWILAILCWMWQNRSSGLHILVIAFVVAAAIGLSNYFVSYMDMIMQVQQNEAQYYGDVAARGHNDESLGMQLVINQPLPVRLVVGSVALMVYPIPLWAHFHAGAREYHIIKGYHGVYQLLIIPLVLSAVIFLLKELRARRREYAVFGFLLFYLIISIASVVVTSFETRHTSQFLPALIILAVLPDVRIARSRLSVANIAGWWFAVVVLVHVSWAIARFVF